MSDDGVRDAARQVAYATAAAAAVAAIAYVITGGAIAGAGSAAAGAGAGAAGSAAAGQSFAAYVTTQAVVAATLATVNVLLAPDPLGPTPGIPRNVIGGIQSVRWVLGETRVAPVEAFIYQQGRRLHIVYLISEGACDSITGVYINGERIPFRRYSAGRNGARRIDPTGGQYENRVAFYEYFRADGNQGFELQANPTPWTSDHRLNGISWVYGIFDGDGEVDERFPGKPEVHFIVRGLKLSYPTNAQGSMSRATWTDNAATIRYWWITQRLGIPAQDIDFESFNAARILSSQTWSATDRDSGARFTGRRYTINGIIQSGEQITEVEKQMNIASSGFVSVFNNTHFFYFGQDRPVAGTITQDDLLEAPTITQRRAQDRYNAITATLAQSELDDYEPLSLPTFNLAELQNADDRVLLDTRGAFRFVKSPVVGYRLMQIALTYSQAGPEISVACGMSADLFGYQPGDILGLTIGREYGLGDGYNFSRCQVLEISYDMASASLGFRMKILPSNLYNVGYGGYFDLVGLTGRPFGTISTVHHSGDQYLSFAEKGWTGSDTLQARWRDVGTRYGSAWHYVNERLGYRPDGRSRALGVWWNIEGRLEVLVQFRRVGTNGASDWTQIYRFVYGFENPPTSFSG